MSRPSDEDIRDYFIWDALTRLISEVDKVSRRVSKSSESVEKARGDVIWAARKDIAQILEGMVARGVADEFADFPPELLWQGVAPDSIAYRIVRRVDRAKGTPPWDVEVRREMEGGKQWLPLDIDDPIESKIAARLLLWAITPPDEYPSWDEPDDSDSEWEDE